LAHTARRYGRDLDFASARKNDSPQSHGAHREHDNIHLLAEVSTNGKLCLIVTAKRGTLIVSLVATQNYLLGALGGSVVNILVWFGQSGRLVVVLLER
jgi:hypothetical protein